MGCRGAPAWPAFVALVSLLCLCHPAFPYSREQLAAIHAYYNNSGARSEAAKSAGERRKEKGARLADLRNKRNGLQKDIDDLKRRLEDPALVGTPERERLKADLARREGDLARTDADYASEKKEYGRLRAEEGKINAGDATRKIGENKGKLQQYSAEQDAIMKRQNEIKEALKAPDLPPEEKKALEKEERALDRQFGRNKGAVGRLVNESQAARGVAEEEWNAYTNNTTKMMNEKRSRVDEIDLEVSAIRDRWKTPTDMMRDPLSARMDQDRLDGLQKERNGLAGTLANYKMEAERTSKKTGLGLEGFGDLGAQNTRGFGFKKSEQTLGTARRMAAEGLDNSEELLSGLSSDPRYKASIDDIRAKNPGASGKELVDRLVEAAERNKTRAYEAGMDALMAANDPEKSLSTSDRKRLRDKSTGLMGSRNKWDELSGKIATAKPDAIRPVELVGNEYWATTKDAYDRSSWAEKAGFNMKAATEEWKHGDIEVDAFKEVVDPSTGKKKMAARNGLTVGLETAGKVAWDAVKNMIAEPTSTMFLAAEVGRYGPAPAKVGAGVVAATAGLGALGGHVAHNLSEDFAFSPSEMGMGSKLRRDKDGKLMADLRGKEALEFNDQMGRVVGTRRPKSGFWDGVGDLALAGGKTGRDLVTGIPDMIKGGAKKMFDGNASGLERFEGFADMTMGVVAPVHGVKGFKKGLARPTASLGEIGKTAGRAFKGDLFAAPGEVAGMVAGKVSRATGSVGRGIRDILNTEAPPSAPKQYWKKTDGLLGGNFERDFPRTAIETAKARGVWSANKAAEAEIAGRTKEAEYYRGEAKAEQAEIFYEAQEAIRSSPGNHRMTDIAREAQEAIEGRMPGTRAPPKKRFEVSNPYTGERLKGAPPTTSKEPILSVGKVDGKLSVRRGTPPTVEEMAGAPVKGFTPKYRELIGKLGEQFKSGRESSRRVADAIDYGDVDLAIKNVPGAKKALSEMDRVQSQAELMLPNSEKVKFTEAYTKASGRILSEASPHRKIGSKKPPSKDFDVDEGIVDYDPVGEVDVVKSVSDQLRPEFKAKDLKTEAEFLAQRFKYAGDGKESFKASSSAKPPPWPSFEQQQADLAAEIASAKPPEPLVRVGRGPSRSRLPEPLSKEQLREATKSGELSRLRDQAKKRIGEPPPRDRNSVEELQEFIRQKSPGRTDRFSPGEDVSSRGPPQIEYFEDPSAPMGLGSRRLVSAGDRSAPRAAADRAGGEKISGKSPFQDEWGQRTPRDLMGASRLGEPTRKGTNIDRNSPTTKQDYEPDAGGHLLSIGKTTNAGLKAARQAKDPTMTTAQRRDGQKNYQMSQEELGRWEESPGVGEVAFKARTGLEKHRPTEKLPGDILKESAKGKLDRGVRITEAVDVPDAEALPQLADGRYSRSYITDYGKNVKIGKDGVDAVRIKDLRRPAIDRGKYPGAFRDVNPDNVIGVEPLSREQITAAKEANMGFKGKSIERRARAVDDAVGGRSSKNEPLVSVSREGAFERGAKVGEKSGEAGAERKGKRSGLIPKETLDAIQRDYSVEQVMADHGIGKGENKKYAIRSERTPSASKLPRGNLVYDHGTGKTYNPITLEMELSGVDYATAARRLMERRPVTATNRPTTSGKDAMEPPAPPTEVTPRQREVIAKVRDAANKQLRVARTPDVDAARKHLADRGITPEEIAKNKLGILPENITPEKLAKGTGLSVNQLREAGFVAKSDRTGKDHVTLKGRITIPKGDYGMEGRTTKEVTVKNPKYKSLKDLPKREGGIEEISGEEVVITEGAFKKIALERKGVENVISTSGTTKPDLLMSELKKKGVKKVRIVPDPDPVDPGKKVSAGFEKADKLEAAAKKAGLDVSRHEFAKPGEVPKGYDIEKYLADGGSLEKIGLTPKRSAAGEKVPRAPPGKGGKLVSAADQSGQRRATPDRREARVDQAGAEKQNLQNAIDDLSRAREEMLGVGSEEAAVRANQKIQDAKKNLITAMRDPNIKTTLTPEGIRAVNAALAEPRTLGRNAAKSRAPPVDPYSKSAREYAEANPGKVGPGAAGMDAPEFEDKVGKKQRSREDVITPDEWRASPLKSVMKRYGNADEATRWAVADQLQLHKQNMRPGVSTGGEAKQRAAIDATIEALKNPPPRPAPPVEEVGVTPIKKYLKEARDASNAEKRTGSLKKALERFEGSTLRGKKNIIEKYKEEFTPELKELARLKKEASSGKPSTSTRPARPGRLNKQTSALDDYGREVPGETRKSFVDGDGVLWHRQPNGKYQVAGGGLPKGGFGDQPALIDLPDPGRRYRVNSADDITRGSKVSVVAAWGKIPRGWDVKAGPAPEAPPLDQPFTYYGIEPKMDPLTGKMKSVEKKQTTTLRKLSRKTPPDVPPEESNSADQARVQQQEYHAIWSVIKDDPRYTVEQKLQLTHLGAMKENRAKEYQGMKSTDAPIDGADGITLGEALPAREKGPLVGLQEKEATQQVRDILSQAEKRLGHELPLDNPAELRKQLTVEELKALKRLMRLF